MPMLALPTIIVLFLLGPLLLGGFVAVLLVPFILFALRGRVRDPSTSLRAGPPGLPGSPQSR
ncbi:MAG: hypothetical protein HY688_01915 [Chloroflexi bacterium]|nr:hypothetical protein [Chloroflexota bacterium]